MGARIGSQESNARSIVFVWQFKQKILGIMSGGSKTPHFLPPWVLIRQSCVGRMVKIQLNWVLKKVNFQDSALIICEIVSKLGEIPFNIGSWLHGLMRLKSKTRYMSSTPPPKKKCAAFSTQRTKKQKKNDQMLIN